MQPTPTTSPTPSHRLADALLGDSGPLEEFVRSRRRNGRSWRLVARDLYEATDHEVDLTIESLRSWFPDQPAEVSA